MTIAAVLRDGMSDRRTAGAPDR